MCSSDLEKSICVYAPMYGSNMPSLTALLSLGPCVGKEVYEAQMSGSGDFDE